MGSQLFPEAFQNVFPEDSVAICIKNIRDMTNTNPRLVIQYPKSVSTPVNSRIWGGIK